MDTNLESSKNINMNVPENFTDEIKKEIYVLLINNNIEFEIEIPFATIGLILNNNGFNKERFGFTQMKNLIEELPYFSKKIVEMNGVPQIILTLHKVEEFDIVPDENYTPKSIDDSKVKNKLFQFAYFKDIDSALKELAEMALYEDWGKKNWILRSYLNYTFEKQFIDDRVTEKNSYAAFNTGLFDKKYRSIIALFKKNPIQNKSPYLFKSFCIMGARGDGKILSNHFSDDELQRAAYFSRFEDFYFDYNRKHKIDYDHILIDNINRIPLEFIAKYSHGNLEVEEIINKIKNIHNTEKETLYERLRDIISKDDELYFDLQMPLKAAVELSCNEKIQQNYKLAVPLYYPTTGKMGFLMPLSLIEKFGKADVALVMNLTSAGIYQGHTILDMDMAYVDARLINRPDSEWLRPAE